MANNHDNNKYFEDRAGTNEARFHVVPHDEEGWAVKAEGNEEPEYTADSKSDAVEEAKRLAKEAGTMAYVHDEDGQIETQHNYME